MVNASRTPPRYDFLDPDRTLFEHFGTTEDAREPAAGLREVPAFAGMTLAILHWLAGLRGLGYDVIEAANGDRDAKSGIHRTRHSAPLRSYGPA